MINKIALMNIVQDRYEFKYINEEYFYYIEVKSIDSGDIIKLSIDELDRLFDTVVINIDTLFANLR